MGVIYGQIPIRLQLSTASAPAIPPIDANTGMAPKFYRAQSLAVQVAIFDAAQNPVDISNLASLNLLVQPNSSSTVASFTSTVLAANFDNTTVSWQAWTSGDGDQVEFDLTALQTDLPLGGAVYVDYFFTIQGITNGGAILNYGSGTIRVYNAGASLPAPIANYTSFNQQANSAANAVIQVNPGSPVHTERIDFSGVASSRSVVINPVGQQEGAQVRLLMTFPKSVAGIVIYVYNQSLQNAPLTSFYTPGDSTTGNAILDVVLDAGAYQNTFASQPAFA